MLGQRDGNLREEQQVRNPEETYTTAVCQTRLIEDIPSDEDQFASSGGVGPHERIAKAIADIVLSPEESGGKMIGLEGGWGSGKSTVVNLLKKQVQSDHGITVFAYDA